MILGSILFINGQLLYSQAPGGAGDAPKAGMAFKEAERLFMQNKPAEAIPQLEAAIQEDPANINAVLYLGIACQQLGRHDAAIDTLRKGLPRAGGKTALFSYNIGNSWFAKGSATFAEQFYTKALEADPSMASAYLNRANSRIRMGALKEAVNDYDQYLILQPSSPKRTDIEKIVNLINSEIALAERERAAAEEALRQEEIRRKKLLEEVAASLQAAAEDTRGLSSGSEKIKQYDEEFELE